MLKRNLDVAEMSTEGILVNLVISDFLAFMFYLQGVSKKFAR